MSAYFNPEKDVVEQCGEGPYYEGQQYTHWDGRIFVYQTTTVFGQARQDWLPYDYIMSQSIGATGAIGLAGPKGLKGDDGLDGEQGEPGLEGPRGEQGSTGIDGGAFAALVPEPPDDATRGAIYLSMWNELFIAIG